MVYIVMTSPENSHAPRPHISPGPPPIRTLHVRLSEILQELNTIKATSVAQTDRIQDSLRNVHSVLRFLDDMAAKEHEE